MHRWIGLTLVGLCLALAVWGAPPARAAELDQDGVVHVVQRGETLFGIARRYGVTVDAICAANGIANSRRIYVGQRLVIPTSGSAAGTASGGSAAPGGVHVVQPGENLYRIALRYGTTIAAMAEANGIRNPGHVFAGQKLVVPGGAGASPAISQPQTPAAGAYTVRAGDTLVAIARRYGVSVWTLAEANGIANPSLILPGRVLTIPGASSAASPSTTTWSASAGGKRIVIDISEQRLYAYQGGGLVYAFLISTGMNNSTRVGSFRVLDRIPNAYASTWNLQMPYWLGIYWSGSLENGIHALPILSNGQRLWEGHLGRPASFGCIILGTADARTLYQWAEVGTQVDIQH